MGFSRLPDGWSGREIERGRARARPRHFLNAAPNSRDRLLDLNIAAFGSEVNVWEEVVQVLQVLQVLEVLEDLARRLPSLEHLEHIEHLEHLEKNGLYFPRYPVSRN